MRRSVPRRSALLALLCCLATACASSPVPEAQRTAEPARSSAAATPTPDPEAARQAALDAQVTATLARLDRDGQLAQLFVVGVHLDDLSAADPLVRDTRVGGIFLRGRSTVSTTELAATTARWRSLSPGAAPWVAADQEGGRVQTLSGPGFGALPAAWEQAQLPPAQLAAVADGMGASLASAGVTLNLAPVADVVPAGTEGGNAPIGALGRHYGSTAATMTPTAQVVIDGLAAHGVTATLKHFPGLGHVQENTDNAVGVTDTVIGADHEQVAAFGRLARSPSSPFVMMSSATYAQIDPAGQAAFSRPVVTDLLRGQLGFGGVVISDDLGAAIAVQDLPPGERAVRFLAAGGTLVLTVDSRVAPEMLAAVRDRAAADPAFAAAVDGAVRTALLAKARLGMLPG
ncbi:glycoside hydrolase family 3 protein [Blastococcus sp. CT_GayMR19]|uniref:glycoside hydrolase family 3 N-terminal domain-containing protein n=1 Tax=Blastococcus sp. CT_GayMR19 TaxID=2559608 RepID=UPI001073524C|nr:glycoside hydrolase family 3 N-terminal domain-containing protein [Blastococcus sp. CT_GayMR19]TFV74845.1 glycoside hydrolase family 3 protein [Blastococcus sp. CT_GayMR19]